ncbi:MAG: hypothetical protein K0S51_2617 [Bacillales bacterium]|jgi:uncharacterized protein YyaL (SSP411 family)|nr:hypothetical protein [Bacillales bacterium]
MDTLRNRKPNLLINEKSPYLLQHAYNPVDWYPWGEEAFELAKKENKPIFLSIGYSTCHWCHVMERESFEDEEIAKLLNMYFVSIKLDREERPDIDTIYMNACQLMTGHGGWPLSVFMTPDKVPYFIGTYFPRDERFGRQGFKEIILSLAEAYRDDREQLDDIGMKLIDGLQSINNAEISDVKEDTIVKCFVDYANSFDHENGGFGTAPKFPTPHSLTYLLNYYHVKKDDSALKMVTKTLDSLSKGGIYDHIGFGFSRYSTDDKFLIPHFEKMLYDNALLANTYVEAYQVTKDDKYKKTAEEIFTYVLRDMQDKDGGFYSAEDADSEGVEGKFYVWTPQEIKQVLGEELGNKYCRLYNFTNEGNFEGYNIPNLIGKTEREIESFLDKNSLLEARTKLFNHREKRVHPHKDDKILTSWNALMIVALTKAARVFDNGEYGKEALRALEFIENELIVDGRVMVRYRDGEVKHKGIIDDYAFLLWAYIEVYETTLKTEFIEKASALTKNMIKLFWDEKDGGFFLYGNDTEKLIIRPKESYDGAMPSGNSVAAVQMLRLAKLTGQHTLEEKVNQLLRSFSFAINMYPTGHVYLMQAVMMNFLGTKELVALTNNDDLKTIDFIKKLQHDYIPNLTYLISDDPDKIYKIANYTKDYEKINGQTTIYLCENYACGRPTIDIDGLMQILN